MKRKLFAVTLGVAAAAVFLAFSAIIGGQGTAKTVIVLVATVPLAIPVGLLLQSVGVDVAGVMPLLVIAFFQWLILGYLLGGIVFRETTLDTRFTR